jgi:HEPN domain-containing protein
MLNLYESKSFNWALFIGHISIEKLLKAVFVKVNKEHAPYTHNLLRLSELSRIELSDEYSDWLDKITSFNINARYDDYKNEFYKQCTPDFTKDWIGKINKLRTWINQML